MAESGNEVVTRASSTHGNRFELRLDRCVVDEQDGSSGQVVDHGVERRLVGVDGPGDGDVLDGEERRAEHREHADRTTTRTTAASASHQSRRRLLGPLDADAPLPDPRLDPAGRCVARRDGVAAAVVVDEHRLRPRRVTFELVVEVATSGRSSSLPIEIVPRDRPMTSRPIAPIRTMHPLSSSPASTDSSSTANAIESSSSSALVREQLDRHRRLRIGRRDSTVLAATMSTASSLSPWPVSRSMVRLASPGHVRTRRLRRSRPIGSRCAGGTRSWLRPELATSVISASTSSARPPSSAWMKLACLSDTVAVPRRWPRSPARVDQRSGADLARHRVDEHRPSVLAARLVGPSPGHDLADQAGDVVGVAVLQLQHGVEHHVLGASALDRKPSPSSSTASVRSAPSTRSKTVTSTNDAAMSEPWPPAFMRTAPPIEPGTPTAHSNPLRPAAAVLRASTGSATPAERRHPCRWRVDVDRSRRDRRDRSQFRGTRRRRRAGSNHDRRRAPADPDALGGVRDRGQLSPIGDAHEQRSRAADPIGGHRAERDVALHGIAELDEPGGARARRRQRRRTSRTSDGSVAMSPHPIEMQTSPSRSSPARNETRSSRRGSHTTRRHRDRLR